jgi:hypothetical protein
MTVSSSPAVTANCHGTSLADPAADVRDLQATAELASVENTRAALLRLDKCPADGSAMVALWEENREIIESEIHRRFRPTPDAGLLERVLAGLASHARFFCEEIDHPKAWVARCANLESRRVALQLRK